MTTEPESSDRDQHKASGRILQVLSGFASDAEGYGITELSNLLGMTKNMVYRALTKLVEQGYIVRDATGLRYQLGYRMLELQNSGTPEPDLRALAAPAIRQIYELIGETVSLMVRALDYAVFIDGIETRRSGTFRMEIGAIRPLHGPATGLVMLAFGPDRDIADYLKRHPRLDYPGRAKRLTADQLWSEIKAIRDRGYGMMLRPGPLPMLSIAFPIWSADNQLHGVLSTGGPEERFSPLLDQSLPQLRSIMNDLCSRTRLYPAGGIDWELG